MTKRVLYVYKGSNGVIWSPILLPMEHTTMSRLIADDGKVLTDGNVYLNVIDVEDTEVEAWKEVELTPAIQLEMDGGVQ